jgi:hypothetical protein
LACAQSAAVSVALNDTVAGAHVDRAGDFYFVQSNAYLQKFDKDGQLIASLQLPRLPEVFDPTNAIRLLVFDRNGRRYTWLSANLELNDWLALDESFGISPDLICPSGDHNLWVLDGADQTLRKVDPRKMLVLTEFKIEQPLIGITAMREYLNLLFVQHKSGISVFNALGKNVRQIPGATSLTFMGEELYYTQGQQLVFFNLYTAAQRQEAITQLYDFFLLTDERQVTVTARVAVFQKLQN